MPRYVPKTTEEIIDPIKQPAKNIKFALTRLRRVFI